MDMLTIFAGAVGLAVCLGCVLRPAWGLLLFAAIAPLQDVIRIGSVDVGQVVGLAVVAGALIQYALKPHPLPGNVLLLVLAVLFWAFYALVTGWFSGTVLFRATVGALLLALAMYIVFHQRGDIEKWFLVLSLSAAAVNAATLFIVAFVPALREVALHVAKEGVRMIGQYDNPNNFGAIQVFVIPLLLYFVTTARYALLVRVLAGAGVLVSFAALLFSQSRSAIISVIGAVALLGVVQVLFSRRPLRNMVLGGLVLGGMVWGFLNLPEQVFGLDLARVTTGTVYEVGEEGVESRYWLYEAGLEVIVKRPEGLGYLPSLAPEIGRITGTQKVPHNFALTALIQYGVLGGTFMVILFVTPPLLCIARLARRRLAASSLGVYAASAVFGFLLHNLFHNNVTSLTFWMYWVACVLAIQQGSAPSSEAAAHARGPVRSLHPSLS